ncbi:MAG TPA: hypothetical protein VK919_03170 [Solirubrobacterales bacterium]|nr:hypothetical protein [Solirubrobacterales bacterium]
MGVPARIGGFAIGLVALFALAALAGAKVDPSVDEQSSTHPEEPVGMNEHTTSTATQASPPGLAVAAGGYRLVPERTRLEPGAGERLRFRIVDSAGEVVDEFDLEHERRMHLILVRRDFAGFQHLHPEQREDGSWVANADLRAGGVYRAFADFSTAGTSLTLATDIFVAGAFEPQPLPAPAATDAIGDGYEVSIDSATPASGAVTPVRFTVNRNGREIDSVEPYLGADGHLVALREHDQAFLHTHPEGEPGGPGPIAFGVEYPTAGRYRLFLQFRHRGEVRTAAFTQEVGAPAAGEETRDGDH